MKLSEVKRNMHKSVLYDGGIYFLSACKMWLDEKENEFKYALVLIDKNQNSTITVPMERVEVIENRL